MANPETGVLPSTKKQKAAMAPSLATTWIVLGHAVLDVYTNLIPPLMHLLVLSMGLRQVETGIIFAALQISGSGLQPLCGFFIDRRGKMWLLSASILFTAFFAVSIGYATTFPGLLLAAILLGLGSAVYHPLGSVAVNRLAGDKKNFAISLFSSGGHFGYALAPIIVVYIVGTFGFKGLAYLFLPGFLVSIGLYRQRDNIPLEEAVADGAEKNVFPGLRGQIRSLLLLNIVAAIRSWAQLSIIALLPWYLMEVGFSEAGAGQMLTPFLLVGSFGAMVGGYLTDHLLPYRPVIAGSLAATAGCLLLLLKVNTLWGIWLALLLLGTFLQGMVPVSIVMGQELIPQSAGMVSGMMLGLSFGIGGIGVTLTSYFSEIHGANPVLFAVAICLLIGSLLAWFLPEKS
jgi:FSR family fosmidomycin resistance protein-like MFS transporter